jgi:hypothetical protein
MFKHFSLLFFVLFLVFIQKANAQNCQSTVQVLPTNPTACGVNDGKIKVTEYVPATLRYQWSINGTTWNASETEITGLAAGLYLVRLRDIVTQVICRSTTIELHPIDAASFTSVTVTNSTCNGNTGSITLNGTNANDSVSWISKINRMNYVRIGSLLPTAGRISGLATGTYYIRIKKANVITGGVITTNNTFCYTDRTVVVGPVCPVGALCPNTSANLFSNGNFGSGAALNGPALLASETQYGYTGLTCSAPDDGLYAIANTSDCNGATAGGGVFGAWDITDDHTPLDVGGYMMIVNASFNPDVVIERTILNLCPNTEYEFSAWVRNLLPLGTILPNISFLIDGRGRFTSGNITGGAWQEIGFRFVTGASQTSATFSIRNNAPGGSGNDWAIDDIFVGLCIPDLSILPPPIRLVCLAAASETIGVIITDTRQQFDTWQWQESLDGGLTWAFIGTFGLGSFNASNQYIASYTIVGPLGLSYNGRKYRIRVASTDFNLTNPVCSYISDAATITIQIVTPPVASAAGVGPACTNGVLALSGGSTVAGSTYSWSGPSSYTSTLQTPSITPPTVANSGTYTVTVTEPTGTCSNTASVNITVNAPPNPTAANNGPICVGQTLNLSSAGGSTYMWTGPLSYGSMVQNPSITAVTTNMAGPYVVKVTDTNGCMANATTNVVINSGTSQPGVISY